MLPAEASKRKRFLPLAFVIAGCLILYAKTLRYDFVWDDYALIVMQDKFRHWENLKSFFTVPFWFLATGGMVPYHRPIVPLVIFLTSVFSGTNPEGYHLLNVCLYALNAGVYYLFLRRLPISSWAAGLAAALFVLHPVHAEPVSWVCCFPVLISGLCYTLLLYASTFLDTFKSAANQIVLYVLMVLIFSIALLTYHSILSLPLLIFLLCFWRLAQNPGLTRKRFLELGLYIFLTALSIFFSITVIRAIDPAADLRTYSNPVTTNMVYEDLPWEFLLAPLNTLTRALELLVFPVNLVPDVYFRASALSFSAVVSTLGILLSTVWIASKTHRKAYLFAAAWTLLGFATTSNLVNQGGIFADRYLYISSMGFALWLALSLEVLQRYLKTRFTEKTGRNLCAGILSLILCGYGIKTWSYTETWTNDFRFWVEASILSPDKPRGHEKLGLILQSRGHDIEAIEEFQKTLRLDPENFPKTYHGLALSLKRLGQNAEAKKYQAIFETLYGGKLDL